MKHQAANAENAFSFVAGLADDLRALRVDDPTDLKTRACKLLARMMRTPNEAFRRELVERRLVHFGSDPALRPLLPRILSKKDYRSYEPLFATRLDPDAALAVNGEFVGHELLRRGDPAA